MSKFEYEDRYHCVCGDSLRTKTSSVAKMFSAGSIRFVRCIACGSWCQSPMVTVKSMAGWFDSHEYQGSQSSAGVAYVDYGADEANRVVESRGRYRRDLEPILKRRSNVLEIGCATGSLLSVLREHGHQVSGVDLSVRFADLAMSQYGVNVAKGDFMVSELPRASYDAILVLGTVSNFRDIRKSFGRFRELLCPEGLLIFNFPDADSLWVRLLYRHRFWMFTPSIATFMTARGCIAALSGAGLGAIEFRNDFQQPSWRKLVHHSKLDLLLPMLRSCSIADSVLPYPIPAPSVRFVVAKVN